MSVAVTTFPIGTRLTAGMTCPRCGAPMIVVNTGRPLTREWRAVMHCNNCRAQQLLLVRLVEIADLSHTGSTPPVECGTPAGYQRHRRHKEATCDACKTAHAASERANARKRARR